MHNEVLMPEPGSNVFKHLKESRKIATESIEDLCGHLNHVAMCSVSTQIIFYFAKLYIK